MFHLSISQRIRDSDLGSKIKLLENSRRIVDVSKEIATLLIALKDK